MIILEQFAVITGLTLLSYWLFSKLHFPASAIMGPMLSIGTLQIVGGGFPQTPLFLVNAFQIIIGLSIGAKINHKKINDIRRSWKPSVAIAVYTLISTAAATLLVRNFTSEFFTALFSAAPGGVTEMTMMALPYDCEIAVITTFQFVRVLAVACIIPLIAKLIKKKQIREEEPDSLGANPGFTYTPRSFLVYAIGVLGGGILIALGFPGGGIIGAMTTLGMINIFFQQEYLFPGRIMRLALIGVGATIGLEFSPLVFAKIQEMLVPMVGFSILIVFGNLIIGWFIHHYVHWDIITCLLGSAPGGLTQMVVVGEEMKADTVKISILQLVRVLTIITGVPLVAALADIF